jgi:hypothetical protein
MRLAVIALFFSAVAFGQSAPPGVPLPPGVPFDVSPHLKTLKLLSPRPLVVLGRGAIAANPGVCSIPLRQALSPDDKTDYRIGVFKPTLPPEPQAKIMPPCN